MTDKMQLEKDLKDQTIKLLKQKKYDRVKQIIDNLWVEYNNGEQIVSDETYHFILDEYLKYVGEGNRPYLRNKQSSAVNDIVGTLQKVFGVTEPFRPDQKCYVDWAKERSLHVVLQPKLDGMSIAFDIRTKQFFTRGDYDDGTSVNVTELFEDRIDDLCKKYKDCQSVKFEALMSNEIFNKLKLKKKDGEYYTDSRSATSGIISSRNIELCKYISLIDLRISWYMNENCIPSNNPNDLLCYYIGKDLFKASWGCHSQEYDTIQNFINQILENGATVVINGKTYNVDGVVISPIDFDIDQLNDSKVQKSGYFEHFVDINEEIAIKILNVVKETKIIDIEYQFGLAGRITPVAKVESVEFDGRNITSIGLSTLDRVQTLAMMYGDTVRVTYNIVPYLLSSNHDGQNPIPIPTMCPHCGDKFDMTTLKQVKCRNKKCVGMRLGSIIRYCQKMNMFGIDRGNITKLWEAGIIDSIYSLYELTVDKICSVPGFKEKSAKNIIDSIKKGSTNTDFYKWLGAWPMDDVGSRTWKAFLEQGDKQWTSDNPRKPSFTDEFMETFTNIERIIKFVPWMFSQESEISWYGFGDINKMKMCKGMEDNSIEMKKVFPYIKFKTQVKSQGKVCLSGTRNKNLIANLQAQGWEVVDTMTKDVRVLLTTDMDSKKAKTAAKEGIFILPINPEGSFEDFQLSTF